MNKKATSGIGAAALAAGLLGGYFSHTYTPPQAPVAPTGTISAYVQGAPRGGLVVGKQYRVCVKETGSSSSFVQTSASDELDFANPRDPAFDQGEYAVEGLNCDFRLSLDYISSRGYGVIGFEMFGPGTMDVLSHYDLVVQEGAQNPPMGR